MRQESGSVPDCPECRRIQSQNRRAMRLFSKAPFNRRRSTAPARQLSAKDEKDTSAFDVYVDDSERDDDPMPLDRKQTSRPASIVVDAQGSYYRRPTLREILDDKALPPWTLGAFTAYCSNNLCLENLEFTIDVKRYEDAYIMFEAQHAGFPDAQEQAGSVELVASWERLVLLYIKPGSPREVNIPGDIRNPILAVRTDVVPPSPELLRAASGKVFELMQDSILFPFINDTKTHALLQPELDGQSPDLDRKTLASSALSESSPTHTTSGLTPFIHLTPRYGATLTQLTSKSPRLISAQSQSHGSNTSTNTSGDLPWVEDMSLSSPATTHDSMATPPASPDENMTRKSSPRGASFKPEGTWKKVGAKLGLRKRSGSFHKEHISSAPRT